MDRIGVMCFPFFFLMFRYEMIAIILLHISWCLVLESDRELQMVENE